MNDKAHNAPVDRTKPPPACHVWRIDGHVEHCWLARVHGWLLAAEFENEIAAVRACWDVVDSAVAWSGTERMRVLEAAIGDLSLDITALTDIVPASKISDWLKAIRKKLHALKETT